MVEASNAPRVTNRLTDQIATTRLEIELAEPRVAAALAIQEQANAAIDATDDHAAEALAEVLHDYRNVLGIADHKIAVRKRPGKEVPEVLPELCISQQQLSFDDGGVFSVDRLVITAYAATDGELSRLDHSTLLGLLNRAPEQMAAINAHGIRPVGTLAHFAASGIGNAAAVESLEGSAVRKAYVVDRFKGNLLTPRINDPLTAATAVSVGKNIAERSQKMANGLSAWVMPDSGKVIKDGANRIIEVAVEARTAGPVHGLTGDGIGRLIVSGCPIDGTVLKGLGRVTKTEVVKTTGVSSTSCRLTVQIHAEALTA